MHACIHHKCAFASFAEMQACLPGLDCLGGADVNAKKGHWLGSLYCDSLLGQTNATDTTNLHSLLRSSNYKAAIYRCPGDCPQQCAQAQITVALTGGKKACLDPLRVNRTQKKVENLCGGGHHGPAWCELDTP